MSATNLTVQLDSVSRLYRPPPNTSLLYTVNVQVWSQAAIATQLSNPKFTLRVDGITVGQVTAGSATFQPHGNVKYTLRFVTTDGQIASVLSSHTSSQIAVSADTISSAGLYSGSNQASTTKFFDFPPAMIRLFGTVTFPDTLLFDYTCCYLRFDDGAQSRTANISRTDNLPPRIIFNWYSAILPNSVYYTISVWRSGTVKICDTGTLNLQATVDSIGYNISC